jgi:pimeloyl-ACP methyl ester carboxylesterase
LPYGLAIAIIAKYHDLVKFLYAGSMITITCRKKDALRIYAAIIAVSMLVPAGCRNKDNNAASTPQTATVVSGDGVTIGYKIYGSGTPALVFVHGWSCDSSYWDAQVAAFSRNHRVITIDLAGHGRSGLDRTDWSMKAFGGDVAAVVKALDLKEVVLVGHSMGGDVILEAVQQIPERVIGLVLVDSFRNLETKLTQEQIDQFVAAFRTNFAETTDNFVRRLFGPAADPDLVEKTAEDMSAAPQEVAVACLVALNKWRAEQLPKIPAKVTTPIISISSDSRPIDKEAFESSFRSFKFMIVSGVGHFVMIEDPERFNELLSKAIEEFQL